MGDKPVLIEPGIHSFLKTTLKECHRIRTNYENYIFNMSLLITFVFILATILFLKYRGKPTLEEKRKRERIKKEYILSKIQNFQESREELHKRFITGLPSW